MLSRTTDGGHGLPPCEWGWRKRLLAREDQSRHEEAAEDQRSYHARVQRQAPSASEQIKRAGEELFSKTIRFWVAKGRMGSVKVSKLLWDLLHDQIHHRAQLKRLSAPGGCQSVLKSTALRRINSGNRSSTKRPVVPGPTLAGYVPKRVRAPRNAIASPKAAPVASFLLFPPKRTRLHSVRKTLHIG